MSDVDQGFEKRFPNKGSEAHIQLMIATLLAGKEKIEEEDIRVALDHSLRIQDFVVETQLWELGASMWLKEYPRRIRAFVDRANRAYEEHCFARDLAEGLNRNEMPLGSLFYVASGESEVPMWDLTPRAQVKIAADFIRTTGANKLFNHVRSQLDALAQVSPDFTETPEEEDPDGKFSKCLVHRSPEADKAKRWLKWLGHEKPSSQIRYDNRDQLQAMVFWDIPIPIEIVSDAWPEIQALLDWISLKEVAARIARSKPSTVGRRRTKRAIGDFSSTDDAKLKKAAKARVARASKGNGRRPKVSRNVVT